MANKVTNKELPGNAGQESLSVGERILILNQRVKAAGFSGLGELVGVHRVTVSGWVTGKRLPSVGEAEKLLQIGSPLLTAEILAGGSAGRGRPQKTEKLDILKPAGRKGGRPPAATKPPPPPAVAGAEEDEFDW